MDYKSILRDRVRKYLKENNENFELLDMGKSLGVSRASIMLAVVQDEELLRKSEEWIRNRTKLDAEAIKSTGYVGRRRLSKCHLSKLTGISTYRLKIAILDDAELSEYDSTWYNDGVKSAVLKYISDADHPMTVNDIAKYIHSGIKVVYEVMDEDRAVRDKFKKHNATTRENYIDQDVVDKIVDVVKNNHNIFDYNKVASDVGMRQIDISKYIDKVDIVRRLHRESNRHKRAYIVKYIHKFIKDNGYYDTNEVREILKFSIKSIRDGLKSIPYIDMIPNKRSLDLANRTLTIKKMLNTGMIVSNTQLKNELGITEGAIRSATRCMKCHGMVYSVVNSREAKKKKDLSVIHEIYNRMIHSNTKIKRCDLIEAVRGEIGGKYKTIAHLIDIAKILPRVRIGDDGLVESIRAIMARIVPSKLSVVSMEVKLLDMHLSVDRKRLKSVMDDLSVLREYELDTDTSDVVKDRRIKVLFEADMDMTTAEYVMGYEWRYGKSIESSYMYYAIKKLRDPIKNDVMIREHVKSSLDSDISLEEGKFIFFLEHPEMFGNSTISEAYKSYYISLS